LILEDKNPEKVLYRSTESICDTVKISEWNITPMTDAVEELLGNYEKFVPEKVLFEIRHLHSLEKRGLAFSSQMITWQKQKSGLLASTYRLRLPHEEQKDDSESAF